MYNMDNTKELFLKCLDELGLSASDSQLNQFYKFYELLIEKNKCYGNSALEPLNCFYKGNAENAIKVRIDDKLSRIMRGKEYGQEDTIKDLLGYLVLLKVSLDR